MWSFLGFLKVFFLILSFSLMFFFHIKKNTSLSWEEIDEYWINHPLQVEVDVWYRLFP